MKVQECMSRDVRVISPDDTIERAAQMMAQIDAGVLPVGKNDKLVGMIPDRDIAIRGVAEGCKPDARVGDIMSQEVLYCYDDEDTDEVLGTWPRSRSAGCRWSITTSGWSASFRSATWRRKRIAKRATRWARSPGRAGSIRNRRDKGEGS